MKMLSCGTNKYRVRDFKLSWKKLLTSKTHWVVSTKFLSNYYEW